MVKSEISGRLGMPEFAARCDASGKQLLRDEGDVSFKSGQFVSNVLLRTSALTGRKAEMEFFTNCEFTGADVLISEAKASDLSGRLFRSDQEALSSLSGRKGHVSEFITCFESGKRIAPDEADKCEVTGERVCKGMLQTCASTGKHVLASKLGICKATTKRVLRDLLVSSSLSKQELLQSEAIRSLGGLYCLPTEAKACAWSGRSVHPSDIRTCHLTGLPVYFEYLSDGAAPSLRPLRDLLSGKQRQAELSQIWTSVEPQIAAVVGKGKCRVESATLSPDNRTLAICTEVKTLFGIRVQQVGVLYSVTDRQVVGRLAKGRRTHNGWEATS